MSKFNFICYCMTCKRKAAPKAHQNQMSGPQDSLKCLANHGQARLVDLGTQYTSGVPGQLLLRCQLAPLVATRMLMLDLLANGLLTLAGHMYWKGGGWREN